MKILINKIIKMVVVVEKNKKTMELKMLFIGYKGVGKTVLKMQLKEIKI